MSEHTPGPWKWMVNNAGYHTLTAHDADGWQTDIQAGMRETEDWYDGAANEDWERIPKKESDANDRLIAVAPTLLDLVRRLTHPMATEEDVDDALALLAELDGPPFYCRACGRLEDACSADPCEDVLEERDA